MAKIAPGVTNIHDHMTAKRCFLPTADTSLL